MEQDTGIEGRVVGGTYRLLRRIGESTPARYEATHPRLAGRFEAKLWPPTAPWDDRVRRGAEVAATLRHRGVVQVIDFNCEPGEPSFLVTEWVDGTKLSDVMAQTGLLSVSRVAGLVDSAAWALGSAHQAGIIHGDLRPELIYVVEGRDGAREWTKIDGFGVAGALADSETSTPSSYRAPEGVDDARSDQYALAAIAYEMLSGVLPFENPPQADEEAPSLLDMVPGVPAAVDTAIRRGLATDPAMRFASVLDFARALREAAQGLITPVVRIRPPGYSDRLRALAGRVPFLPASVAGRAGVAAALVLVVGLGVVALRRSAHKAPAAVAAAAVPAAATPTPVAPAEPTLAEPPPPPPPPVQTAEIVALPSAPARAAVVTPKHPAKAKTAKAGTTPVAVRARAARAPARPVAGRPADTTTAPATADDGNAGAGLCLVSIESTPAAQVWLDDHNTGRRTPLIAYHVHCGAHKLALRRDDLHIDRAEPINVGLSVPFRRSYSLK